MSLTISCYKTIKDVQNFFETNKENSKEYDFLIRCSYAILLNSVNNYPKSLELLILSYKKKIKAV